MRIVIVGLGRMGSVAAAYAVASGHEVSLRIDPYAADADAKALQRAHAQQCDVAIEFSVAEAVVENAARYAEAGVTAVVGTTGWAQHEAEVQHIVAASKIGYLHAPNFSIGVHVFLRAAAYATRLFDALEEYDSAVFERHHRHKADSPSGTALALGNTVLASSTRKQRLATERLDRAIEGDELHVASVRGGEEPGTHTLAFDSLQDTVELTHRARGREALAAGAIRSALWLQGKQGFFTIDDFLADLLPV